MADRVMGNVWEKGWMKAWMSSHSNESKVLWFPV